MATKKAISLDNNTYWDSSTIVNENNETLDGMFSGNKSMGNIVVDSIRTKNMFDENWILNAYGWSKNSSGYYTGYISDLLVYLRDNEFASFEANTQYTFQWTGYRDGGNPRFEITYTDDTTSELATITGTTSATYTGTSTAGKTIKKVNITAGSNNIMYVKNIQWEKGTTATTFTQYQGILDENNIKNKELVVGGIRGKNLFNEIQLLTASDWSKNSSGYYYGSLANFHISFSKDGNHFTFYEDFKANARYRLTMTAYVSSGASGYIYFDYTDGTSGNFAITSTSAREYTATSAEGKTVSKIRGTYGNGGTLYIKNMQLEEGTTSTNYAPYQELSLELDMSKKIKNLNSITTLSNLVWAIINNNQKICYGEIGDLHSTNLKTLLGNPNIGNYSTVVFEPLICIGYSDGCIRATTFSPYTDNTPKIGFLYFAKGGNDYRWTGWKNLL